MKTIRKAELRWKQVLLVKEDGVDYERSITTSNSAAPIIKALIGDLISENLMILMLDTKNRVLGFYIAGQGGTNSCAVKMADVFREAIAGGANNIIVSHNHPSCDLSPSSEDIQLTKQIIRAGKMLGIGVLDHIITTCYSNNDDKYFSFQNAGLMSADD
jgi:DNA repair protein RadC